MKISPFATTPLCSPRGSRRALAPLKADAICDDFGRLPAYAADVPPGGRVSLSVRCSGAGEGVATALPLISPPRHAAVRRHAKTD